MIHHSKLSTVLAYYTTPSQRKAEKGSVYVCCVVSIECVYIDIVHSLLCSNVSMRANAHEPACM